MSTATMVYVSVETETIPDLQRLQGAWVSLEARRPVELFIAGRHFTARFKDGELYMGSFDLFPDEQPAEMVMWIEEGPPRHHGRITRCIYTLEEGETLRWCPANPGTGERLADFPDLADKRHLCTLFERHRPQR